MDERPLRQLHDAMDVGDSGLAWLVVRRELANELGYAE